MIIDGLSSLRQIGVEAGRDALVPFVPHPANAGDDFALRVWSACGTCGRPLRTTAGPVGSGLEGWGELIVCARVAVSPYRVLREAAAGPDGLPAPIACLTLGGDGLEGQHGRSWRAEPGNLHLSVALPCDLPVAACGPSLPMLAAVALCDAAQGLLGADAARQAGLGIKWVNDIVLGGGKAGGVLTALRTEGPRVTAVFAGLALNLAVAPTLPPDPLALPAATLADAGPTPELGAAAVSVLERLSAGLRRLAADGPEGLVADYRARSVVLGREVVVWPPGTRERLAAGLAGPELPPPARCGRVTAIEPDLSLRLEGQVEPVRDGCLRLAGDPARPCRPA